MAVENGIGPPKGSALDSPLTQPVKGIENNLGGKPSITQSHPAFQPPYDPLKFQSVGETRLVYRDIPLIDTISDWTVDQTRAALRANMWGIFEQSAQLCDAILSDDRVQATLGSRISGLFGREVRFKPADDSFAAQEVCDAWVKLWPSICPPHVMTILHAYAILMGWVTATINWDTGGDVWCPYLYFWHPRYTYYHWDLRKYVALSQDGQLAVMPGNAKWLLHAPYGEYRGWVRGAIRACAEPWLIRHWAIRDWARFSEKHGMPITLGICPASADETQRDRFQQQLTQLASETTMLVSRGNDGNNGYDVELREAKDTAWEAFPGLRDHCDMAIVLALLFQNLTTEVKGGAFAAATAHMDIRQSGIQYDGAAWERTIYDQVARPFAWVNFGDQKLAPITTWDVAPREEYEYNAKQFQQFGTAVEVLRRGGIEFVDTEALRKFAALKFGLDGLPDFIIKEPVAGGTGGGGFGK